MAHFIYFVSGGTGLAIIAHAVNTFPTPKNAYGQWFLGVIQYVVGQRSIAANTQRGFQTEAIAVTSAQKTALANGSTMQVIKVPEGMLKPTEAQDAADTVDTK